VSARDQNALRLDAYRPRDFLHLHSTSRSSRTAGAVAAGAANSALAIDYCGPGGRNARVLIVSARLSTNIFGPRPLADRQGRLRRNVRQTTARCPLVQRLTGLFRFYWTAERLTLQQLKVEIEERCQLAQV